MQMSDADRERKQNILKIINMKEKKLLNHLSNGVEELENFRLNK